MKQSLDMIAFGAHADDVEIGMAGTIAKYTSSGKKVGIFDLTNAELSSNGNVELRKQEASKAAEILGVEVRGTLDLPDRGLYMNHAYIKKIVQVIRKHRPSIVFAPYEVDRHPDHGQCAKLVEEAFFSSGIRKYDLEGEGEAYRPKRLYFYMINGSHQPDFLIDTTKYMDKKIASLNAYESQFVKTADSVDTPLVNGYVDYIQSREMIYGRLVGTKYAEGFKTKEPLLLQHDLFGE